jgi:hypothetical protein
VNLLAEYDPIKFDTLPPLDEAEAAFTRHEGSLRTLAKLVSEHGADERVGLALLHRHFALEADERLIEKVDHLNRHSVSTPRRVSFSQEAVPHLFRPVRVDDGYRWYPLEFVDVTSHRPAIGDSTQWLEQKTDLLNDLASSLDHDGALGVFGISLKHGREDIPCDKDEVLVETTDSMRRMLTMRPRKLHAVDGSSTPTNWSADSGQVVMRCTCQRAGDERHGHFETN